MGEDVDVDAYVVMGIEVIEADDREAASADEEEAAAAATTLDDEATKSRTVV